MANRRNPKRYRGRCVSIGQMRGTRLIGLAVFLFTGIWGMTLASQATAVWPGTNGRIYFSSNRDGNFELYSMNADGSAQTRLTSTPGDEFGPSVSANGRWVTFVHNPTDADEPGQRIRVELMRTDGTDRRAVTGSNTVADFSPTFAPDGTTIVFSRETDPAAENGRLWRVRVDGEGAEDLIAVSPFREYDPEFAPDGTRIYFSQEVPASERIYSVNADGSNPTAVSPAGRGRSEEPSTSPDGTRIAYGTYRTPVATSPVIEVQELSTGLAFEAVPQSGQLVPYGPAYAPDGSTLAFTRYDDADPDSNPQIYTVSATGGPVTDLTGPSTAYNSDPYWAPTPTLPEVSTIRQPRKKAKKRTATFRFRATSGTTLSCRLDRRKPRTCPTDRKVTFGKLRRGKHQLRVTPMASDPTAAALGLPSDLTGQVRTLRWRVR